MHDDPPARCVRFESCGLEADRRIR